MYCGGVHSSLTNPDPVNVWLIHLSSTSSSNDRGTNSLSFLGLRIHRHFLFPQLV